MCTEPMPRSTYVARRKPKLCDWYGVGVLAEAGSILETKCIALRGVYQKCAQGRSLRCADEQLKSPDRASEARQSVRNPRRSGRARLRCADEFPKRSP